MGRLAAGPLEGEGGALVLVASGAAGELGHGKVEVGRVGRWKMGGWRRPAVNSIELV